MVTQISVMEEQVKAGFGGTREAEIYPPLPGLGRTLGARVLAEFGDNDPPPLRRRQCAEELLRMSPAIRASDTKRVVLARPTRNRRLADALYQQAFAALTSSPGSAAMNRPGLVGVLIVWKRGWTHAEGHHSGEADHASLQP